MMINKSFQKIGVCLALTIFYAPQALADNMTNEEMLLKLQKMIEQQQVQINKQAAEIDALKEKLGTGDKMAADDANKPANVEKLVKSGNTEVDVSFYGQVNRGGLWADNGDSSRLYFVDNDNSSTRLGVNAKAKISELTFGGKIEYELESNSSKSVNIENQNIDAEISLRHADIYVEHDSFGKFSFGRGSSATEGSSEVDLSGTAVITRSSISDMAGGQLFYDSGTNALSGASVNDVFTNMDGLSRLDRFRYDTPSFAGFIASVGANEEDAYDLAGRYSRKYGGLKFAMALGWVSPGDLGAYENQYNGSFSVLHDSGFNFTGAGGLRDYDPAGREDATFWYAKLGYQAKLLAVGKSAFAIDFTQSDDVGQNDDEARSYSLAYVQNMDDWATELYLAYRLHELDRTGEDLDDINAIMAGARIKF